MREVLESEIELAENSQLYNWFNGKITYVELPDPNEETVHWIAADCVHPDIRGQRVIAEDVWEGDWSLPNLKSFWLDRTLLGEWADVGPASRGHVFQKSQMMHIVTTLHDPCCCC